jgi:hypothetical protein
MADVDFLSKRYGVLPSEVVKLDLNDFTLCLAVAMEGLEAEAKAAKKAAPKMKGKK